MDANIPSGLPGIDLPASHSGIYLRLPLARLLCHFKAAVFVMPILLSLFTPTPAQAKAKKDPGKASIDKSGWHGWYWPTDPAGGPTLYDKNGPLSKFDAFVGLDDARGARSYEEKHDGAKGATWWGHCDPWSASSINQAQPTTPHAFNAVALGVGDQKGLITEYYDDNAGSRHGHIISGSSKPAVVWKALQQYVRDARTAIVFELNPGQQVWNHPVYRYEVEYQPAPTPSAPDRHRCNLRIWAKRDVISPDFVDLHDEKQTFSFGKYSGLAVIERQYDFEVDVKNGVPVVNTGTWTSMDHPDFVWVSRRGYFSSNKELIKEVVDFVVYGGKLIVDNPTTETPAQAGDVKHPQPIDVDIRLQTQQGT